MKKKKWTLDHMPRQEGKTAVVTGANSGLGFYTARALALKGAKVIMACRNVEKGETAKELIRGENRRAEPEVWHLDLASMESVRQFAVKFLATERKLDLLINNAGLMAIPYHRTADGFEMQFGVNHLGHFALTALLWPVVAETKGSRVIQVSSLAHIMGWINFKDIHWENGYRKWSAYGMSKLANLLFVRELANRLAGTNGRVTVAAAHPGYADTELQAKGSWMKGNHMTARAMHLINRVVAQSAEMGALPTLYAATAEDVDQGAYFGPAGLLKLHGHPAPENPSKKAVNDKLAARLWKVSESLTGIAFRV